VWFEEVGCDSDLCMRREWIGDVERELLYKGHKLTMSIKAMFLYKF